MFSSPSTPQLQRPGHVRHCKYCLFGLPGTQVGLDASRLAIVFYCIGTLDLLGLLDSGSKPHEREEWRRWIWEQYVVSEHGAGFRPGPFVVTAVDGEDKSRSTNAHDTPHIIMTYTAVISLSILQDDLKRLDKKQLLSFLRSCQREDGSFSTIPGSTDSDLRTTYCAFAIFKMLDDWSGIDIPRAVSYIQRCRSYEGGYGQYPWNEAQGGTTYTALASLYMIPEAVQSSLRPQARLTDVERAQSVRWLVQQQTEAGGFSGRTGKEADACYCFWCSASLDILGAGHLVDESAVIGFMGQCQFKFGGIAKAPGEDADPYHTYLSLAALSLGTARGATLPDESWKLEPLNPLLNARTSVAEWAQAKMSNAQ